MNDESASLDRLRQSYAHSINWLWDGVHLVANWFLVTGHRLVVAGLLVALIFLLLAGLELWRPLTRRDVHSLYGMVRFLIVGNLSLIPIAVSVNQLIISRQLSNPSELQSQIEKTAEFRQTTLDTVDRRTAPATPKGFLAEVLDGTRRRVNDLADGIASVDDASARESIEELVCDLSNRLDSAEAVLDRSEMGVVTALETILHVDFAALLNETASVKRTHGDVIPDRMIETFDELIADLQRTNATRGYFKALFIKRELSELSRMLLYTSILGVLTPTLVRQLITELNNPTAIRSFIAVIPLTYAAGLAPLTVLFAYMIRISVLTQQTNAVTPFSMPDQQ